MLKKFREDLDTCLILLLFSQETMSANVEGSLGKKIKTKGAILSWVAPLYATPLDIIFDKKNLNTRKDFVEKYDLCNKGPNPKCLRIGKDLEEEEVEELFGKAISRNGYRYCHTDNEEFITKCYANALGDDVLLTMDS
jgi:hypothetical protein